MAIFTRTADVLVNMAAPAWR